MTKTVWQSEFSKKWFWKTRSKTQNIHGPYKTKQEAIESRAEYCRKFAPQWLEFSESEDKFVPIKIEVVK